ncbi:5-oxoprolinase subunit PxpA [Aestuariibaculum suncheonense]|uniref:5-oxoprolinase subunit PxpA n=1 Tax=Aestuariibaculum suncheonense TaxID=1028745 RepID=A0A8J6UHH6_9FLAO|nr:5-oxoprolinase subunit PxpA [Aestuariibaculum suncheonense]MBD0835799.1 5-oxoprolinase subunit PxpA [Aestuariibaculum suncheonense]
MEQFHVDVNADVGEGVGNEAELMPFLSSCNIACGGHAGDTATMRKVVALAKVHGVKVGAHPSFPDREHFGRQPVEMSCVALFASLKHQIDSLLAVLKEEQVGLHHIKPHGALYNMAATDIKLAEVVVEVIRSYALPMQLYVPYGSVIADVATQNNIPIVYEVFADRNYNDDLSLVSRAKKEALIHDVDTMFEHVYRMISLQEVKTIDGTKVPIRVNTICVHGDNMEAIKLVQNLWGKLVDKGVKIY